MTEQLEIPGYFLTLSPNDNWPIYNLLLEKDGEQVQKTLSFKTYHANVMMNRQLAIIP